MFALLGPNGAGKTTTVEILEGYRRPDGGTARVLNLDPFRSHSTLMSKVGLMLQEGGIYPDIRVGEAVELFGSFFSSGRDGNELLVRLGLGHAVKTRYKSLSRGQQQRLALVLALLGRPQLLFLDEPTAGMDPQARHETWDLIRSLKQQGVTVVLTTHFMEEAELLADQVGIIDHGKLVALGQPSELMRSQVGTRVYVMAAPGLDVNKMAFLPACKGAMEARPGYYVLETEKPGDLLAEVTAWMRDSGVVPTEVRVGKESLEDVYLRLTSGEAIQ